MGNINVHVSSKEGMQKEKLRGIVEGTVALYSRIIPERTAITSWVLTVFGIFFLREQSSSTRFQSFLLLSTRLTGLRFDRCGCKWPVF